MTDGDKKCLYPEITLYTWYCTATAQTLCGL